MRLRLLAITPVLGALLALGIAPTIQEQEPPKEQVVKLKTALVVVTAQARTANGEVLQSLASRDFLLYDNKVQQEIAHFERKTQPLEIAVMIDTSGSMYPRKLATARLILKELLSHLQEDDAVALFDVGDKPKLLAPSTFDKQRIFHEAEVRIWGASNNHWKPIQGRGIFLHDSVYAGTEYLKTGSRANQRLLVIVTDNETMYGNSHSGSEVLYQALENDVLILGFVVGNSVVINPFGGDVNKYAEQTGGSALHVRGGDELLRIPEIVDQLRTRYVLGYYPATLEPPDKPHSITLRVQEAVTAKYGQVKLSYRRQYQPVIE